MGGRPPTMRRERIRYEPGALVSPWLSYQDMEPLAVPADQVAERLGVTVEEVVAAKVEPYIAADGAELLSVHLVAIALGQRRTRLERQQKRQGRPLVGEAS